MVFDHLHQRLNLILLALELLHYLVLLGVKLPNSDFEFSYSSLESIVFFIFLINGFLHVLNCLVSLLILPAQF